MNTHCWTGLLAMAIGCLAPATQAAGSDNPLLFVSTRDGQAQVYRMNADGSEERALTVGPQENTEPAWSADGRRIAFTSYRDGNAEIYTMDANGANPKRLTSHPQADTAPVWTPDGRIVFRSTRNGWSNFYVMNADGANVQALTASPVDKGVPLLSPDGRWIAFIVHGEKGGSDIHVVSMTGGDARNVTGAWSGNQKLPPSWSPDSRRLAYAEQQSGSLGIRVIGIGTGTEAPVKVTDNAFSNASPAWSPDGQRLAFVSSREGSRIEMARGDIYVMNADGSGQTNLTHHPAEDNYPVWSTDGQSVLFVSLRDGLAQIYAVPMRGGEARRLSHSLGHDLMVRPQSPQTSAPVAALSATPPN